MSFVSSKMMAAFFHPSIWINFKFNPNLSISYLLSSQLFVSGIANCKFLHRCPGNTHCKLWHFTWKGHWNSETNIEFCLVFNWSGHERKGTSVRRKFCKSERTTWIWYLEMLFVLVFLQPPLMLSRSVCSLCSFYLLYDEKIHKPNKYLFSLTSHL